VSGCQQQLRTPAENMMELVRPKLWENNSRGETGMNRISEFLRKLH
jgi:hypothetical protein